MAHERDANDILKLRGDGWPEGDDPPELPAAAVIGGDETGANTGVKPGERPIIPGDEGQETPVGNDPTAPGGGHGEGP